MNDSEEDGAEVPCDFVFSFGLNLDLQSLDAWIVAEQWRIRGWSVWWFEAGGGI